jgi:hypothetical protein
MSLSLKISTSEHKNSFVVFDCTGNFSSSNTGGYGVKNPKITNVEEAFLDIYTPKQPFPSGIPFRINVFPDMPNDTEFGYEINPSDIGQENEIESGKYTIVFTVKGVYKNGVSFSRSTTYTTVFVNSITCCVDKEMKHVNKDAHKDEKQKKIIELNNLLQSVQNQIDCELFDTAAETIEYLKEQCKCCGCK